MIRPGDFGFGGKRKGVYPKIVRFLTRSKWSHCFVVMPEVMGELCVIEADLKVQVVSFHKEYVLKDADYYEIWRPIRALESDINTAVKSLFEKDAGEIYGFLQIPWFAVRAIMGYFGLKLNGKNPFPEGEICSETLWQYFANLRKYSSTFEPLGEDECSPEDLYRIVSSRPDLFEKITERL